MVKIDFNEEKHEYKIGSKKLISVTTILGKLFRPFERDKIAAWCASDSKSAQEFLDEWDEAAAHGTRVHAAIENHILKKPTNLKTDRDALKTAQGLKVFNKLHRSLGEPIIYPELIVGNKKLGIAGTIDLMIEHNHPDDTNSSRVVTLVDWKTNKAIKTNSYGKKGIHTTTKHLDDCNYTKYNLQLSLYAYLLELEYGYKIDKLILAHLKEDSYDLMEVPYLREDIIKILKVVK